MKGSKIYTKFEFLLMIYLILLSGSMTLIDPIYTGVTGGILFLYSIHRKDYHKRKKLWWYLFFICVIFIGQMLTLEFISYLGSINVLAKIITGATIMWILKERFRYVYLDAITFFAAASLFFFALQHFAGVDLPNIFPTDGRRTSLLIYNTTGVTMRNFGPFWEPGAFACYLMLVPILFIDDLKSFVNNNKTKVIILIVALITTYSTTGYICLFAIIIYYYMTKSKNKFITYLIYLPIALGITLYAYKNLEFMSSKIEEQAEYSLEQDGEFTNTRIGSLLFDMHYIKKNPLFGNGLHERTRYADHPLLWGEFLGHGNAFSNYAAQMGVVALLVYFILLYKAFGNKLIVPIIVALLFQGEQLMNFPLYPALPFIILSITNNKELVKSRVIQEKY